VRLRKLEYVERHKWIISQQLNWQSVILAKRQIAQLVNVHSGNWKEWIIGKKANGKNGKQCGCSAARWLVNEKGLTPQLAVGA
jgi:hypothetical protein